jgi:predicted PurR-regulated permease PerM
MLSPRAALSEPWLRALVLPLIILAWLAVLLIVGWLLSHITRTILLVVLAVVLAFAFTPLANLFQRWMPRPLAIGLAYLVGLAAVIGFGAYIVGTTVNQVGALVNNLPEYAQQAQALVPRLELFVAPLGISTDTIAELQQQGLGELQSAGTTVARESVSRLAEVFGTFIDIVLVLILSIYLASNGARIARWLETETPSGRTRARARLLVSVVSRVVGGYVRGVLTLALLVGVMVGGGLAVLGVPYAVLLGVLAFFMEFVPVLGVFISGAASLFITLFAFGDLWHVLIVLGYFVLVHIIEGDVVGPRIMSKAVGIHPATGLIALVAGTELFGVWGALFAAPIAGLLQAIAAAAWIELRGTGSGRDAREVVQAAADETSERTAERAGI